MIYSVVVMTAHSHPYRHASVIGGTWMSSSRSLIGPGVVFLLYTENVVKKCTHVTIINDTTTIPYSIMMS